MTKTINKIKQAELIRNINKNGGTYSYSKSILCSYLQGKLVGVYFVTGEYAVEVVWIQLGNVVKLSHPITGDSLGEVAIN